MKYQWVICGVCQGEGTCAHQAMRVFTGSEWSAACNDDPDFSGNYRSGAYDVKCDACNGRGSIRKADISTASFAEKRAMVEQRRELRASAFIDACERAERAFGA